MVFWFFFLLLKEIKIKSCVVIASDVCVFVLYMFLEVFFFSVKESLIEYIEFVRIGVKVYLILVFLLLVSI